MKRSIIAVLLLVLTTGPLPAQFLGKSSQEWSKQLTDKSTSSEQRRNAAFALGQMGRAALDAFPFLNASLDSEQEPAVKEAILFAIGDIVSETLRNEKGLEEKLCIILNDKREKDLVRRSAAYALGCHNTKSELSLGALRKALSSSNHPLVRQNAAWALGQAGESALGDIRTALHDSDSLVKRDAANAVLQMRDGDKARELIPDLLPLCQDANSETQRAAVSILVRIVDREDKGAAKALQPVLQHRDTEIRRNAALAMSNIGGADAEIAVPVLVECMRSEDPEFRRQATLGLRNLGLAGAKAVPELLKVLREDKDREMRHNAAIAIGGIGVANAEVVHAMVDRVLDEKEDTETRVSCAMALALLGPNDRSGAAGKAISRLVSVLENPNQDIKVREKVIWALRPHHQILVNNLDVFRAFCTVMKEPNNGPNKMLRYDCAYMLGMIWNKKAPDDTLDVLAEFLRDPEIKIYDKTSSSVAGAGNETGGGTSKVIDSGTGDGRTMATQALKTMGAGKYRNRPDIIGQLQSLADDNATYAPLRKQAQELLRMAK